MKLHEYQDGDQEACAHDGTHDGAVHGGLALMVLDGASGLLFFGFEVEEQEAEGKGEWEDGEQFFVGVSFWGEDDYEAVDHYQGAKDAENSW